MSLLAPATLVVQLKHSIVSLWDRFNMINHSVHWSTEEKNDNFKLAWVNDAASQALLDELNEYLSHCLLSHSGLSETVIAICR